ncbi:MAG TPA: HAD family hydrolase [Acidobacteriota bacterium]|nr:HAD family hydrolase [Acidobacteriota bacterium]
MKFKCLIFDLDGTLVDSYPAIHESLNETLKHFGLQEVDEESVKKMVGRGLENLIRNAVGLEHLQEGVSIFKKSYDRTHLHGTFLLPEVKATLQLLHRNGLAMAVASNKPSDYSKNILHHLGIGDYFSECYGPDIVQHAKPHPAMLQGLMKVLKTTPDQTLYVGDMILDLESAHNAGVKAALIATGGNSFEELQEIQPDFLLRNFSELINWCVQ